MKNFAKIWQKILQNKLDWYPFGLLLMSVLVFKDSVDPLTYDTAFAESI